MLLAFLLVSLLLLIGCQPTTSVPGSTATITTTAGMTSAERIGLAGLGRQHEATAIVTNPDWGRGDLPRGQAASME